VPLTVSFSSSGSYDPDGTITGWHWDFGDNTTSTDPNPTHTYQYAGTFTAQLTVTDNGYASASDVVTITASGTSGYVYVADQSITRATKPGGKWFASDLVLIKDDGGQPVGGAGVSVSYSGPTSGSASGTTSASGEVTFETTWSRTPGSLEWCFTVTDVQATGKTYNPTANVVTTLCEVLPKTGMPPPRHGEPSASSCRLHPVAPNPVSTESMIRFSLPDARHVTLRLYDMLGRAVATVAEARYPQGTHTVQFDRGALPAGMYVLQLKVDTEVRQQMICIR
ncbi:MAG: PKD domain-containing protein, partial [Bacteroidetes bacterium]|nr:PKD domain-containing protein [Bacteroidota bacterium]